MCSGQTTRHSGSHNPLFLVKEMSEDDAISSELSIIVSKIIGDIRKGLLTAEMEQRDKMEFIKKIVTTRDEKERLVTDDDVDECLSLNFPRLLEDEVDTVVRPGSSYRPSLRGRSEEPRIEEKIGYRMKKDVDFFFDEKKKTTNMTMEGITNIRNFLKQKMEKERRRTLHLLATHGYPIVEVEGFNVTIKAVLSHVKPGKLSIKMPSKISNDVIREGGNIISEIKIDLRTKKEYIS